MHEDAEPAMSERPNDPPAPEDDPSVEPEAAGPSALADGAMPGIRGTAATDVEGGDALAELPEHEADASDESDEGEVGFEPYDESVEPEENVEPAIASPQRPKSAAERRAARAGLSHGQLAVDPALRIKDRASAIFVLITVGVFVAIFLNAMLFGHGGFFTPIPSPTPIPTLTAAPSGTPSPSITPTAAPSVGPSAPATATPSGTPSPT